MTIQDPWGTTPPPQQPVYPPPPQQPYQRASPEHWQQPAPPDGPRYRGPARTAHGPVYWVLVGWWWAPIKWFGRVLLWLFLWPVGLWRSIVHGRKKREARERRGYR